MDVIGSANAPNVTTGSGSVYQADKLESKIANVRVDGKGKVTVKVSDLLNVEMNGNGERYYLGNPQINEGNHNKGKIVKMA